MSQSRINHFFQIAGILILTNACAKMNTPSGGKSDITPPRLISSNPVNKAKNFTGSRISLTFDEYVTLDNINDKFLVSPPVKKKPQVVIRNKSVVVEFAEKLKDSTTYTLYFQDAIKDLNEGNKLQDFQFVFSTGPSLDSLSVTGNVYKSLDLEVPEKTVALLYKDLADSSVEKHIPDYITRVDPTGYFRINNVHSGKYRLYALKDDDNSKTYNSKDEAFAFLNSPVEITPEKNFMRPVKDTTTVKKEVPKVAVPKAKDNSTQKKDLKKPVELPLLTGDYQLILFTALKTNHYLGSSKRTLKNQLLYVLSLPPDTTKFGFSIPGVSEDKYFLERSRNNDTLKVWIIDSTLYSMDMINSVLKYPLTDSLGKVSIKTDSVKMRFTAPPTPRKAKVKKEKYNVVTNISTGLLKPGQIIEINSDTPFRTVDTARIKLFDVTAPVRKKLKYSLVRDNTNFHRYFLKAVFLQDKKYLYIADKHAYTDIFNIQSDSTGIKFAVKDPALYSKLTLNITNYTGDRIIQLLDKTENLVRGVPVKKDGKTEFTLLDPGFYRIRVIYDKNGDGKWTTGDFSVDRQPEPVSYYPTEVELKVGWEPEQDWVLGTMNFKDQKLRKKPAGK